VTDDGPKRGSVRLETAGFAGKNKDQRRGEPGPPAGCGDESATVVDAGSCESAGHASANLLVGFRGGRERSATRSTAGGSPRALPCTD
jgi:hypothetical protein